MHYNDQISHIIDLKILSQG